MVTELGLGFPAKREEIERFGGQARRVVRVKVSSTDSRSFVQVVMEKM